MRFIKPSYEILQCPDGEEALRLLELAARTCYKSEDKIDNGYGECATCRGTGSILQIPDGLQCCPECKGKKLVQVRTASSHRLIRSIIERGHHSVLEHVSITVKFICNRGVTHEHVRHRIASYSQESTRYCNYGQEKHGGDLNIIEPLYRPVVPKPTGGAEPEYDEPWNHYQRRQVWEEALQAIEKAYLKLLELGEKPEEARDILPIGLKSEIVATANLREWRLILTQRTSPKAHPQMRELMVPLLAELKKRIPVVFEDIGV